MRDPIEAFFKKTGTILTVIVSTVVIIGFLSSYIKNMSVAESMNCARDEFVAKVVYEETLKNIEEMRSDVRDIRRYLLGRKK